MWIACRVRSDVAKRAGPTMASSGCAVRCLVVGEKATSGNRIKGSLAALLRRLADSNIPGATRQADGLLVP